MNASRALLILGGIAIVCVVKGSLGKSGLKLMNSK